VLWKLFRPMAAIVTTLLLGAPAFAAPNNYSNGEHVTCEGIIRRDPDSGTWLDSTRKCSQTFWQDLERVLEACPEGSRCQVTAIIIDDKHRYGFGRVLVARRINQDPPPTKSRLLELPHKEVIAAWEDKLDECVPDAQMLPRDHPENLKTDHTEIEISEDRNVFTVKHFSPRRMMYDRSQQYEIIKIGPEAHEDYHNDYFCWLGRDLKDHKTIMEGRLYYEPAPRFGGIFRYKEYINGKEVTSCIGHEYDGGVW
jgi:hypothetical protein